MGHSSVCRLLNSVIIRRRSQAIKCGGVGATTWESQRERNQAITRPPLLFSSLASMVLRDQGTRDPGRIRRTYCRFGRRSHPIAQRFLRQGGYQTPPCCKTQLPHRRLTTSVQSNFQHRQRSVFRDTHTCVPCFTSFTRRGQLHRPIASTHGASLPSGIHSASKIKKAIWRNGHMIALMTQPPPSIRDTSRTPSTRQPCQPQAACTRSRLRDRGA